MASLATRTAVDPPKAQVSAEQINSTTLQAAVSLDESIRPNGIVGVIYVLCQACSK